MPRQRRIDPFLLVVVDDDRKQFAVEGPMIDDAPWNHAVVLAQDAGRQVRCFTPAQGTREQVADEYGRLYGYKRAATGSIVNLAVSLP